LESKIKLSAFLKSLILILSSGSLLLIVPLLLIDSSEKIPLWIHIITALLLVVWLNFIYKELKYNAVYLQLNENNLNLKRFFGLAGGKTYAYTDFDAFITMQLKNQTHSFEYLFLRKNGKDEIKISSFYHSNYKEMKAFIKNKVNYAGEEPFTFKYYIKSIFN